MNAPVGIAAPNDPMNEMYEFFAFSDALEDGLDPKVLIQEQAAQGRVQRENRVNQLITHLNELIEVNEREREQLVGEARGLAPREAQVYSSQLSQRVNELKATVSRQEKEIALAEKEIREQNVQNAGLVADIVKLRAKIQRQQENQSRSNIGQLYAAGSGLCQYIANPQQVRRNDHASSEYPSSGSQPASGSFGTTTARSHH